MALIVTGHQRSGATLLVRLFNAHPHVRMTGEFGNFLEVGSPRGRYDRQLLKRWAGIVLRPTPLAVSFAGRGPWRDVVFQNNRFVLEYLRRLHGTGGQVVTAAVIEQVLKELLPGAKIVGDKYPEYIWGLDTLVGVEGLSTLVIYRDCRDVTASTLEKVRGEWRGRSPLFLRKLDTAEKVARRWVGAIECMEAHSDRIFILRYEDLVTGCCDALERLSDWLAIEMAGFEVDRISSRSIGKYRDGLTHAELETVLEIAGPAMERLGYR